MKVIWGFSIPIALIARIQSLNIFKSFKHLSFAEDRLDVTSLCSPSHAS
jgi:hypothetical protein